MNWPGCLMKVAYLQKMRVVTLSGSLLMKHPAKPNTIPVPFHASKEMKKGTLKVIFKLAGIKTNKS